MACLPATPHKSGGDYIKREGLRENKEDGGQMIVLRRPLRTSESNTALYREMHYNLKVQLIRDLWTTTGSIVSGDYSGLQRVNTEQYKGIH